MGPTHDLGSEGILFSKILNQVGPCATLVRPAFDRGSEYDGNVHNGGQPKSLGERDNKKKSIGQPKTISQRNSKEFPKSVSYGTI